MKTVGLAIVAAIPLSCLSCADNSPYRRAIYSGEDFSVPYGLLDVRKDPARKLLIVTSPRHGFELSLPLVDRWEFHVNWEDAPEDDPQMYRPEGYPVLQARSGYAEFALKVQVRPLGSLVEPTSFIEGQILGKWRNSEFEETRREAEAMRIETVGDVPVLIRPWSLEWWNGTKYLSFYSARQRRDGVVCVLHLWAHDYPELADLHARMKGVAAAGFRVLR
jgi:hypothetical protein